MVAGRRPHWSTEAITDVHGDTSSPLLSSVSPKQIEAMYTNRMICVIPLEVRFRDNADIYVVSQQISSDMADGVRLRDGCDVIVLNLVALFNVIHGRIFDWKLCPFGEPICIGPYDEKLITAREENVYMPSFIQMNPELKFCCID